MGGGGGVIRSGWMRRGVGRRLANRYLPGLLRMTASSGSEICLSSLDLDEQPNKHSSVNTSTALTRNPSSAAGSADR